MTETGSETGAEGMIGEATGAKAAGVQDSFSMLSVLALACEKELCRACCKQSIHMYRENEPLLNICLMVSLLAGGTTGTRIETGVTSGTVSGTEVTTGKRTAAHAPGALVWRMDQVWGACWELLAPSW